MDGEQVYYNPIKVSASPTTIGPPQLSASIGRRS
jgi:hypothetical protein